MPEFIISPEFQLLLPMASKEELEELERKLLAEGCRDPLVVTSKGTIIDGMTRYIICRKHKIPFKTIIKDFADTRAARIWIRENQIGRRNFTDAQRIENALELEKERSASAGSNLTQENIAETAAKVANVSENTVRSYQKADASPVKELGRMMRAGDVSINAAEKISSLPPKKQEILIIKGPSAIKAAAAAIRKKEPAKETAETDSAIPDATLITEALAALAKLKGYLTELIGDVGADRSGDACGFYLTEYRQEWAKQIDMIRYLLRTNKPYAVCPRCEGRGKKCLWCKGCGWMTKEAHEKAVAELKKERGK